MLKRDKVIQSLIANGYDEELVNELPKAFIEDYLEKEKETLSEALDNFIDRVQDENTVTAYNVDNNIFFGSMQRMKQHDFYPDACDGLFYNFKSHIIEEFLTIIKKRPLRNILINAGVLELADDYQKFHGDILGKTETWKDLCAVNCISYYPNKHNYQFRIIYLRLDDFIALLENKGIKKENMANPYYIPDSLHYDIFINGDAIMAIGNTQHNTEELVPKKKPEKNN